MSLVPPHTQHICLQKITINIKFPCKVFLVVTVNAQGKQLTKMQTRSVQLINNEAIFDENFSVDISDSKRKALEIQYSLYIETKNGVKMAGKATDTLVYQQAKTERNLVFEKCPDKDASVKVTYHSEEPLERSKVTQNLPQPQDYQQTRIKSLLAEKSRLESQLSLTELQNYQKDIVIKNLSLELRLKAEQNKYLFSAEKLKQVSSGYQQEIRDLKKKMGELEADNKGLKRQLEQVRRELEQAKRQKAQVRNSGLMVWGRALQRMSRALGDLGENWEIATPKIEEAEEEIEHIGESLGRRLSAFERAVNLLKGKYCESTAKVSELQKQLRQSQQLLKQIGQELEKKRKSFKESEKNSEELKQQIAILTKNLQDQGRAQTQQLKKVRDENASLTSTINELKGKVQQLKQDRERQIETQNKLKELMKQQQTVYQEKVSKFVAQLQKWKGFQLESLNVNTQKWRSLQQQLKRLKEVVGCLQVQKLCLEQQRQQYTSQMHLLQQQLQDLQAKLKEQQQSFAAACARSKNSLREISNTNISIAESYSRLRIESEYRVNEQRAEKAMLRIELEEIKGRYETDIQELKRKLKDLGCLEKETMNLCQRLGYSEPDQNDLSAFACDSETKMQRPEDPVKVSREEEGNRLRKEYDRLQNSLSEVAWPANQ